MSGVVIALGLVAWVGLALCVGIAIGLTIREADRRERPAPQVPPAATATVVSLAERRASRVDVSL